MMEVLIDNRDGTVWDMPVSSVQWKTSRIGKAGTLDAKLVIEQPTKFPVNSGAIIRVTDRSYKIFYGYVFETGFNTSSEFHVKAYDQLRYLMYNDTFVFSATTATAGIKKNRKRRRVESRNV
ncbi:hypothetical protein LR68_01301 [Anoxybacillus sp. BCO1]|nr:hypothetical protein LR68_01301 [Anoxybacillus sp. BCO1]